MKNLLIACLLLLSSTGIRAQKFTPQHGDLLFQDLDCGPFCDAIEKVTFGVNDYDFSHVGVAVSTDSGIYVLESISVGTVLTPLDTFLHRSIDSSGFSRVLVGRVKQDEKDIHKAVERALSMQGKPYDSVFDIENGSLYCSELVYFSFRDEYDQSIFDLAPMTFIDPDSAKTFGAWKKYFNDLNSPIPEGELGLNPGSLSRSPFVEIVFDYGKNY